MVVAISDLIQGTYKFLATLKVFGVVRLKLK